MDIISHGLWGGLTFGRKSKQNFLLAFLIGIFPDIAAFGPFFIQQIFTRSLRTRPDYASGHPDLSLIPQYVSQIYNYSHSLIIFVIVFLLVWAIRRKPMMELGAWGLHILFDIPVHTTSFFPTPFLWPLSNFHVNGLPWGNPWIFFPNWIALIILYFVWWRVVSIRRSRQQ